jgi:hypothetical protein
MTWLPTSIITDVEKVARISYIPVAHTMRWNEHRRAGELRLLTGWQWSARDHSDFRQGFKTMSAAYRDCWYYLVQGTSAPSIAVKAIAKSRVGSQKKSSARIEAATVS